MVKNTAQDILITYLCNSSTAQLLICYCYACLCHNTSIGTVTGQLRNHGSTSSRGKRYFSSSECQDWLWDLPILYTPGGKLFLQDHSSWGWEACHSSLYSAKVKNAWNYTSTLPHNLNGSCLIQHRTNSQLIYILTLILMFTVQHTKRGFIQHTQFWKM